MIGLIKNNYYKIISNLKILLLSMFLLGSLILIFAGKNEMYLLIFLCITVIGFPFITSITLTRNNDGKWNQYILSFPIKKREIIQSVFITQISIVLIGSVLAVILFFLSFLIHGFVFYRYVDILLLFSSIIGISVIMNATFIPLSYLDSNNKTEALSIISLLLSITLEVSLIVVINALLKKPTNIQLILFSIGNLIVSFTILLTSYFITIRIYYIQDY